MSQGEKSVWDLCRKEKRESFGNSVVSGPEQNWTETVQNWTGDGTKLDFGGVIAFFRCLVEGRSVA